VFITDNTYARADVLAAERDALDALAFDLSAPTSKTFLRRFVKAASADGGGGDRLAPLAAYICELGLLEYASLHFLPSRLAAAAVVVARVTLGASPWPPALARAARCGPGDVAAAAAMLHSALTRAPASSLPAVRDKYGAPAYRCVAGLPPPPPLPDLEALE
jgi:cyclin A